MNGGPTDRAGSRPIRVLHVLESWPPVVSGYATRSLELLRAQAGHPALDPLGLVSSRQLTYGQARLYRPADLAGRIEALPTSPRERMLRRLRPFHLDSRRLADEISERCRRSSVELIHCHWSSGIGAACARAARELDVPLVAEVRFDLAGATTAESWRVEHPAVERRLRRFFERHLRDAAAVTAASDSLGELLRSELPGVEAVTVLPNAVDTTRFHSPRRRRGTPEEPLLVGSTAKMLRYESLDLLIDAVRIAAERGVPVRAELAGGGPQRRALEKRARDTGAPVEFLGRLPTERVPEFLGRLDVFCLPRRERTVTSFAGPIKLLEAMACECAVLAAPTGEVGDLLADGRGLSAAPEAEAMAAGIERLAADPALARELGRSARDHVAAEHRWSAVAERAAALYQEVLGGGIGDRAGRVEASAGEVEPA